MFMRYSTVAVFSVIFRLVCFDCSFQFLLLDCAREAEEYVRVKYLEAQPGLASQLKPATYVCDSAHHARVIFRK